MKILQLPLPIVRQNDQIYWGPHNFFFFTVCSAYHTLKNWEAYDSSSTSGPKPKSACWTKLRSFNTIPKLVNLALRILHNGLSVKRNLIIRGDLMDSICPCDNEVNEDITHVFYIRPWAKYVWFHSPLRIKFD